MEKIMQEAVHKMAQSEREGAQVDALSRRLVKMNKEMVSERNRADRLEEIIDGVKHHFMEINMSQNLEHSISECRIWFNSKVKELEERTTADPVPFPDEYVQMISFL